MDVCRSSRNKQVRRFDNEYAINVTASLSLTSSVLHMCWEEEKVLLSDGGARCSTL